MLPKVPPHARPQSQHTRSISSSTYVPPEDDSEYFSAHLSSLPTSNNLGGNSRHSSHFGLAAKSDDQRMPANAPDESYTFVFASELGDSLGDVEIIDSTYPKTPRNKKRPDTPATFGRSDANHATGTKNLGMVGKLRSILDDARKAQTCSNEITSIRNIARKYLLANVIADVYSPFGKLDISDLKLVKTDQIGQVVYNGVIRNRKFSGVWIRYDIVNDFVAEFEVKNNIVRSIKSIKPMQIKQISPLDQWQFAEF
jgi:hypothetical protein